MLSRFFLFFLLFYTYTICYSQNKYALVIGINQYQKKDQNGKIVLDPDNSKLKGCVNDAKAIKQLISKNYGFKSANIIELYDFKATKKNILASINSLLLKAKKDDVVIIYYAGHGSTFKYGANSTQTAEYILPTDGFANYRFLSSSPNDNSFEYSFIQTSLLANTFNKFVDKGVVLTAIFDCCHSNGTIGLKKTVSTKSIINGVAKIKSYSFWESKTEMNISVSMRSGLIELDASEKSEEIVCDTLQQQVLLNRWLTSNGNAYAKTNCNGGVIWTNNYDKSNWKYYCGNTKKVDVTFTAQNKCGQKENTSATFRFVDNQKPEITSMPKDLTVSLDTITKEEALNKWLFNHAGATATDSCYDNIVWTNNFDSTLKIFLDNSGSVLVTFCVTDACINSDFARATFTVVNDINPIEYRLTEQESTAIIEVLNNLKSIEEKALSYMYYDKRENLKSELLHQIFIVDSINKSILKVENYKVTGNLKAIQGTALMVSLLKNTDSLMTLLNEIPYNEDNRFIENSTTEVLSEDDSDENSRNANNSKLVLPNGFPYKEFEFKPPSLMPNSKFLFMSATDDVQTSKEAWIDGVKHGVFTAALIEVLENNPKNMKVTEVFAKVKQQLFKSQNKQTPTLRISENRKNQNVFGVR